MLRRCSLADGGLRFGLGLGLGLVTAGISALRGLCQRRRVWCRSSARGRCGAGYLGLDTNPQSVIEHKLCYDALRLHQEPGLWYTLYGRDQNTFSAGLDLGRHLPL